MSGPSKSTFICRNETASVSALTPVSKAVAEADVNVKGPDDRSISGIESPSVSAPKATRLIPDVGASTVTKYWPGITGAPLSVCNDAAVTPSIKTAFQSPSTGSPPKWSMMDNGSVVTGGTSSSGSVVIGVV